ncbi:hypothetical protein A4H97_00070 [Niastella yeongjuensis]|uniref:Uncharacterized protein n=1 Tax=Niastella yeongjuensis TaxID=354355 RepID=A0A1V9EVW1_9BACT|nr:WYL domain-containing protein [Niastella yeongjuensis]OQP50280.1 hypothetical protein A4H97_00070 [Niastella yeongjuensis]SEN41340.1 WYL domain-containing protein [Niastella yeongjuensis]
MSAHIERLIRIYNRLRRGPVTIEIISQWAKTAGIKVSDRQLYRDLNQLKSLQIAEGENVIEYINEKNHKTWKLEYDEASEKISQYDINSFFLLKNFAPHSIIEQRKSSIENLERIVYKNASKSQYQKFIQTHELYMRRTNYFESMYSEIEHTLIEELIWALHNQRIIVIEQDILNAANNHLPENPFPLSMYPMELVFHRGTVRIAGLETKNHQLLLFNIDKTLRVRFTNESFSRKQYIPDYKQKFDSIFGISAPINNRTYHIKIEFTKGYGEMWKTLYWHHSQDWKLLKNGNYMLHLHCSIGRELVGFLVYGLDKVKVHQPKVLQNLIVTKLERAAAVQKMNLFINEEEANKDY